MVESGSTSVAVAVMMECGSVAVMVEMAVVEGRSCGRSSGGDNDGGGWWMVAVEWWWWWW